MDFKLLTQLQKLQEEKLERRATEMKRMREASNDGGQKYINNKGEVYTKKDNIL